MVQWFEQGRGLLWEPLTVDFLPQVREESRAQSPMEAEFPYGQLSTSCHSHLVPQNGHQATHLEVTKWPTNRVPWRSSDASPYLLPGLVAAATFPTVIQWLC